MKLKSALFILVSLLFLSTLSQATQQRDLIIGFGGGYSFSLDESMATWELDWAPSLIYFKERMKIKHNFNLNLQYFFNKRLGLQLEFNHQKTSYFSHLEWRGKWIPNPFDPVEWIFYAINHIEEPYTKPWNISSLTLSLLVAERRYMNQRMFPYGFAGLGVYLLNTDEELVLNRWRLGPGKTGTKMKLGGGLKYRITPKVGLNLRLFFESIWRKYGRSRTIRLYAGTDQFDFDRYVLSGEVLRVQTALVKSFTHIGLDLSLELWLQRKKK